MNFFIFAVLLFILLIIAIEDFKSYQIRLVWLLAFFGISQLVFINQGQIENLIFNGLFILLLLFVMIIYSFVMKLKIGDLIGAGDVLFFVSMCFLMDSFWLVRIVLLSLCFGYMIHHFILNKKYLPLVGYLSMFYGMFICLDFYLYRNLYLGT